MAAIRQSGEGEGPQYHADCVSCQRAQSETKPNIIAIMPYNPILNIQFKHFTNAETFLMETLAAEWLDINESFDMIHSDAIPKICHGIAIGRVYSNGPPVYGILERIVLPARPAASVIVIPKPGNFNPVTKTFDAKFVYELPGQIKRMWDVNSVKFVNTHREQIIKQIKQINKSCNLDDISNELLELSMQDMLLYNEKSANTYIELRTVIG